MVGTDAPNCMTGNEIASLDIFSGRFQSGAFLVGFQEALMRAFNTAS